MQLPPALLESAFSSELRRGRIFSFLAEDLDDPNRTTRHKFAVVLSVDCSAPSIFYIFTTSKPLLNHPPQFRPHAICLPCGSYDCFNRETTIVVNNVRAIARDKMFTAFRENRLRFVGELSVAHLEQLARIIRQGFFVSPGLVPRIVPPAE